MKKTIFLTLLVLIFIGCSIDNRKYDLQFHNLKGNVKSVNEVSYEAVEKFGEITKGKKEWAWYESRSDSYKKYDKNGNVIEFSSRSSEGELYFKVIFDYDDNGNFIEDISYDKDGKKVSLSKRIEDDNGNLIEIDRYDFEGNLTLKVKNKFDDNNNLIESNMYDADGSLDSKIIYKYDEKNNRIEESYYNGDGSIINKNKSKYDNNGYEIEKSYYGSSGELFISVVHEYSFDDKNNWVTRTIIEDQIPKYIVEREIEYY